MYTCESQSLTRVLLSLYRQVSPHSLPTNAHILYCNENTSFEELEIFLRRAFKSSGKHCFTVPNIQALSYEVTNQLEEFLTSSRIEKNDDYILIFISCKNSNKPRPQSVIESLLANNRTKIYAQDQKVRDYLESKLITENRFFSISKNPNQCVYSVRALVSKRSGNGKSTYVKKFIEILNTKFSVDKKFNYCAIRVKTTSLDMDTEIEKLITSRPTNDLPTIYHIDVAHEVLFNVDEFLFNLIVLRYLKHSQSDLVWRFEPNKDIIFIEASPLYCTPRNVNIFFRRFVPFHLMIDFLPTLEFITPREYYNKLQETAVHDDEADELGGNLFQFFYNQVSYQRSVYYLNMCNRTPLDNISSIEPYESSITYDQKQCLETLDILTQLNDPNWVEVIEINL